MLLLGGLLALLLASCSGQVQQQMPPVQQQGIPQQQQPSPPQMQQQQQVPVPHQQINQPPPPQMQQQQQQVPPPQMQQQQQQHPAQMQQQQHPPQMQQQQQQVPVPAQQIPMHEQQQMPMHQQQQQIPIQQQQQIPIQQQQQIPMQQQQQIPIQQQQQIPMQHQQEIPMQHQQEMHMQGQVPMHHQQQQIPIHHQQPPPPPPQHVQAVPVSNQPWYETLPAVAMDYKVHIDPGKEDCYFQYVNPGATFYVSFQVLRGGDGKAGFAVRNPSGEIVHPYQWRANADYQDQSQYGGYYSVCVDNQFSRFAGKLVNLYITVIRYDQWEKFAKELEDMNLSVENVTNTLVGVEKKIYQVLQMQHFSRSQEDRDYNLLLDNNAYVQNWSILQVVVIMATTILQVYFVRRLFEVKSGGYSRSRI